VNRGERVLAVPRTVLPGGIGWRGLRPAHPSVLEFLESSARYLDRKVAETDRAWKQLIPYLVLVDRGRIFLMRRSRAGGDPRLFDRCSIGVGGHVNPGDQGILDGLRREWREELVAAFDPAPRFVGLLNDDTTSVGAVHLGLVFVAAAAGRPVAVREADKLTGSFVEVAEALRLREAMETWSQLILDALVAGELPLPEGDSTGEGRGREWGTAGRWDNLIGG
jgi:predicted NUDIX family phosphoesterase